MGYTSHLDEVWYAPMSALRMEDIVYGLGGGFYHRGPVPKEHEEKITSFIEENIKKIIMKIDKKIVSKAKKRCHNAMFVIKQLVLDNTELDDELLELLKDKKFKEQFYHDVGEKIEEHYEHFMYTVNFDHYYPYEIHINWEKYTYHMT